MFTGIVEQVGTVISAETHETHRTLKLKGKGLGELDVGASIAVNGVCLTAVTVDEEEVSVDLIPETLQRSNLGDLIQGSSINLERPMPATGRFDGHIVQGHVDGIGSIDRLSDDDGERLLTVSPPEDLMPFIVEKGSITVDGVSLTVAGLSEGTFSVALIPHTLEMTTLGLRKPGDAVNLEVDVLAKYVERLLEARK